jgi:hypothetical protein
MSSIVVPCICTFFFYLRIYLYANKARIAVNSNVNNELRSSLGVAKSLFSSFMLFTLCWLPYGVIVMVDFNDTFPRAAVEYSMTIAHLNSSLNPLLYAFFNPSFRKGCLKLFETLIRLIQMPSLNQLSAFI